MKLSELRQKLSEGEASIGSWMLFPCPEVAEVLGSGKFDWVTVDLEHGSIGMEDLPNLFRALELHNTLPFARIQSPDPLLARRALDLGAAGIIAPNIESWHQVEEIKKSIYYAPEGQRGVGYCRGNLYGVEFERHLDDKPFLVVLIESQNAVNNINTILDTKPDAVLIGLYDLSASFNITAQFESYAFKEIVKHVRESCIAKNIPVGMHVVEPTIKGIEEKKEEGYTFIPWSADCVMLSSAIKAL